MIVTQRSASVGRPALVTGAAGQDGYILTRQLLVEGREVHALVRRSASVKDLQQDHHLAGRIVVHEQDLLDADGLEQLVRAIRPSEIYNLAGQSSVSASFADPRATWRTNVEPVITLLEAIRMHSPATILYQSSSSEMFGGLPGETVVHNEDSPLLPQSPYAAAKAAAHLACHAYRESYGLRVACGILFNHESSRRPASFLTRKVVDHVQRLRFTSPTNLGQTPPLAMGNLAAKRDWGFAPDYVDGIRRITGQIAVRAQVLGRAPEEDRGSNYRDYVLGTGTLHTVWELVSRAFDLSGLQLEWDLAGDPSRWSARFRGSSHFAVVVDPTFIRPFDPAAITADSSRARTELGWEPQTGLDPFLLEMLEPARAD